MTNVHIFACCLVTCHFIATSAVADLFGRGDHTFEIEFVTIGDPENPVATSGQPPRAGSVDYIYRIGKYEVDRHTIEMANNNGGVHVTLLDMTDLGGNGPGQPATGISWYEAAAFTNWLNTSEGHPPAYKMRGDDFRLWEPEEAGYDPENPYRNREAHYFLPSADEWFKAAFYDGANQRYYRYATGSDEVPTPVASGTEPGTTVYHQARPAPSRQAGGLSPYGTMGQGGNIWEWEESSFIQTNTSTIASRALRSGSWLTDAKHVSAVYRIGFPPFTENRFSSFGFRVASRPLDGVPGDFNGDGVLDADDIDQIRPGAQQPAVDLTRDGVIDQRDRDVWVQELADTWLGDTNLDGLFDGDDLLAAFAAGKYDTGLDAGWSEGDWNGDGVFNDVDLLASFQEGGYLAGPRPPHLGVPEPTAGMGWAVLWAITLAGHRGKRMKEWT